MNDSSPSFPSFHLDLRIARNEDLGMLRVLSFSSGLPNKHVERLVRQDRGEVVYLLAIRNEAIVGHLLLKWFGPESPVVKALVPSCAEIEDFTVDPVLRNQGVGSAMLEYAAEHSREHGFDLLGLGVGLGNSAARRLYERHGFQVVPHSEHRVSWMTPNIGGGEREDHEDCCYLLRKLS